MAAREFQHLQTHRDGIATSTLKVSQLRIASGDRGFQTKLLGIEEGGRKERSCP